MTLNLNRSLRARLIAGAVVGIVVAITLTGLFIVSLFRNYTQNLIESELQEHIGELTTLLHWDGEGAPALIRPMSDPRFSEPGSGYTWQVSLDGAVLSRSASAGVEPLPVADDMLGGNETRMLTLEGPNGPMLVNERLVSLGEASLPPVRLQVGTDMAVIDQRLPFFNGALAVSLALLVAVLSAAAVLQVAYGLRPMARLRQALRDIETGRLAKLPAGFPSEVQSLVDDMNNLIEVNAQMVVRARAQAGNLAHALKTPLAVLTDEAFRLEGRNEGGSARVIKRQSEIMQQQIDFQLARARAAASRSVPGMIAQAGPAVRSIVAAMLRLHAEKELSFDIDVDGTCSARCDPMDLNEMLANVIDNACKWARGTVRISGVATPDSPYLVLAVEDDGPGLDPESMEVVFGIGERLDERVPGSGLGLPIVRDLARLYGGDIHLERSAMGGLRAVLKLPKGS